MLSLLETNGSVEMKCLLCNLMGRVLALLSGLVKVTFFKSVQDRSSHLLFKLKQQNDILWLLFWSSPLIFLSQFSSCTRVAVH